MTLEHIDPSGVQLMIDGMQIEGFLPDLPSKPDYCYQYADGSIHMGHYKTGFHCVMGQDYFEALLSMKDLPTSQEYISPKEKPYKQAKPWYRKERW